MIPQPKLANLEEAAAAIDFMSLLGRCLGNFKIVERVLATFRETGLSDLNQLQSSLDALDFPAVVEIAHRFKGAASNVSASGLYELLMQAERLGHEQDFGGLTNVLVQLRTKWDNFLCFAEVFSPSTDAATSGSLKRTQTPLERHHAGAGC